MQFPAVIEEIEPKVCPQYLQVYLLFSLPSESLWRPLQVPLGCRIQLPTVKEDTEENFCPQYSQ